MVENNPKLNPDDIPDSSPDAAYQSLVVTEPERKVADLGDDDHKSLSETEAEAPNLTDLQSTLRRLFPTYPIAILDRIAKVAMIARISPDQYLDRIFLDVTAIVEELEVLGLEVNFQEIMDLVADACSIGLEGRGRVDALEAMGAAKDTEELEKLSKGLGF